MKPARQRELKALAILCGVGALVGCGPTATGVYADAQGGGVVDSGAGGPDAPRLGPDAAMGGIDGAFPGDGNGPYRHTINIDGTNDFLSSETFATTSASYKAYVSWDANNIYIGYDGSDIASGDQHKWLFAYFDTDPGSGNGAPSGEIYNTETPEFPNGFAPEFYYRWQASQGIEDFKSYDMSGGWTVTGQLVSASVSGTYLEAAIPLSALGNPQKIGVSIFWINETSQQEAAYGGLYADSFTDGYYKMIPIAHYLLIDLSSNAAPNAAANEKP